MSAGVTTELHVVPGAFHGFDFFGETTLSRQFAHAWNGIAAPGVRVIVVPVDEKRWWAVTVRMHGATHRARALGPNSPTEKQDRCSRHLGRLALFALGRSC